MNVLKGDFVYRNAPFLKIKSANSSTLYTEHKTYIDLQSASGANILGYRNDILERVLTSGDYIQGKPQIFESETRLKYAKKLTDYIYDTNHRHGKVAFEISGAGGIELAVKIAVSTQSHLTPMIFTIESCYHGRSIYASHLSDKYNYRTHHLDFAQHYLPNPEKVMQIHNMSQDSAIEYCMIQTQNLIDRLSISTDKSKYLPILIYETLQNVGGGIDKWRDDCR
jgi:4-aminobutyrate aminotransferase-like enzyme